MSTMVGPARALDGPAPAPPPGSLTSVVRIVDDPDLHYLMGGQVWPYPDLTDGGTQNPCSTGTTRTKSSGIGFPVPTFGAFTIYETITCTARSIGTIYDEVKDRAINALASVQSALIEDEFMNGHAMPFNPFLTDPNVTTDTEALLVAQTPARGLQALENRLALTGKQGLIHADPATAVSWAAASVAEWVGGEASGHLVSLATRTPIAVGRGYIGSYVGAGPLAASQSWAFATGPVDLRWDAPHVVPDDISQAFDREDNTVELRAERHVLITWDVALQAAVLINRAA